VLASKGEHFLFNTDEKVVKLLTRSQFPVGLANGTQNSWNFVVLRLLGRNF